MPAHSTADDAETRDGVSPLGVVTDGQTYKNLIYLFLRFPLGIVYFTVLTTGLATGLATAPFLVGIGLLGFVLAGATYIGVFEAYLARTFLGRDLSYEPVDPGEEPLTDYLKSVLTDPRAYVFVLFGYVSFAVGIAAFTVLVTVFALAIAFAAAPLVHWSSLGPYEVARLDGLGGPIVIDTLPEALLACAVGLVVFVVGLHLVNLGARIHGAIVAQLLGQNR